MKLVRSFKKDAFKEFLGGIKSGDFEKVKNTFNQEFVNKRILDEPNGARPIHIACQYDSADIVKYLIDRGSDIDQRTNDSLLPMHIACMSGCISVVDLLLKKKNQLEIETKDKMRPVHFACKYGHTDVLLILINNKCNITCVTNTGDTPLHIACEEGKPEIVKILLTYNCPLEAVNKNGLRPVNLAKNNKEILELLSQKNCLFDFRGSNCITPAELDLTNLENYGNQIFQCVRDNNISLFTSIYDPCKPIMNDIQTELTLLEFSISEKAYDFVELILGDNINIEKFEKYLTHFKVKNSDIFDRILEEYSIYRAVRFNLRTEIKSISIINQNCILTGSSFMELAVKYDSLDYTSQFLTKLVNRNENLWNKVKKIAQDNLNYQILKLITDREKFLETRNEARWTRLHIAVADNDVEMVKYLLKIEPETPMVFDAMIGSPSNLAAICGRIECFKLVFVKFAKLKNSFHVAVKNGMGKYCIDMMHAFTDLEEIDEDGNTLLHLSAKFLSFKLCKFLLENNCDPNIINNEGNSPLHEMMVFNLPRIKHAELELKRIADLLLSYKSDINIKNNDDKSVFQECLLSKNLDLIFLIMRNQDSIELTRNDLKIIMDNNWVDVLEIVLPQCLKANEYIDEEMLIYFLKNRSSESFTSIWFLADPEIKRQSVLNLLYICAIENKPDVFTILSEESDCESKLLDNGDTLLITLLKMQKLDFCSILINSNLSCILINQSNGIKETPLHIAAKNEYFTLLENMLYISDDINREDYSQNTPFNILIKNINGLEEVERLSKLIISKSVFVNEDNSSLVETIESCSNADLKSKLVKLYSMEVERKVKNQEVKNICNVCLDNVINTSFNCGHTSCNVCAMRLKTCPICRSVIRDRKPLFL